MRKYEFVMLIIINISTNITVNLQNVADIAKDIYDNTLLLEVSTCSYKQYTFLDFHNRFVDHKCITGI